MKLFRRLYFLLILTSFLYACTPSLDDKYLGEWYSSKQDNRYLQIKEEGGNLIVKHDPNSRREGDEETFAGSLEEGKKIVLDNGKFITFLDESSSLLFDGNSFLQAEIPEGAEGEFMLAKEVEKIREVYDNVIRLRNGMIRSRKSDCMEYALFKPNTITKAKKSIACGHGSTAFEYYYEHGKLVFYYERSVWDMGVHSNATGKSERRIYFMNEKPIKYKKDQEFLPLVDLPEWEKNSKEYIDFFSNPSAYPNMCGC